MSVDLEIWRNSLGAVNRAGWDRKGERGMDVEEAETNRICLNM